MTFAAFWAICPRKADKRAAERLYEAIVGGGITVKDARSGQKVLLKATHEEIMAGMRHYAAEVEGEEPKYILHPRTWLHNERWADCQQTTEEVEMNVMEQRRASEKRLRNRVANLRDQIKWYREQEKRLGVSFASPIAETGRDLVDLLGQLDGNVVRLRTG